MYGEETGLHGENHQPVASHSQTLSHNVVSSTPRQILYLMRARVYYVPLRSEFRVVISATFFAYKRCSVRLYLQLFEESSCLIYVICVCLGTVMSNTYCVEFLLCLSSSCVPYVASFSGLSIFNCPFGIP
jgi:hypothetical protein